MKACAVRGGGEGRRAAATSTYCLRDPTSEFGKGGKAGKGGKGGGGARKRAKIADGMKKKRGKKNKNRTSVGVLFSEKRHNTKHETLITEKKKKKHTQLLIVADGMSFRNQSKEKE